MNVRIALMVMCAVVCLSGCPQPQPDTRVGEWMYFEYDGTFVATVTLNANGSMQYASADGNGNGTWSENNDSLFFSVLINSSPSAQLQFDGTIVNPDVIVGLTTSDQPPTERYVYMVR